MNKIRNPYDREPIAGLGETIKRDPISEIRKLENNPDKLVRSVDFHFGEPDTNIAMERCRKARELFDELKKYGVRLPNPEFVLGRTPSGKIRIYTVVDKIYGKELLRLNKEEIQRLADELDSLFTALIAYYEDKYEHGGDFLADITERKQFMYGHKIGEEKQFLYLVDVDPFYYTDNGDTASRGHQLEKIATDIHAEINAAEHGENIKLENARREIINFRKILDKGEKLRR